jgi:DNA-binding transcriptional MerR regulator
MGKYSIKELEQLSGIKAHTIRIWEKRYNIITPERTATNIRFYSDESLKKIINVSLLNNHGVKISRIADMSLEEISTKILALSEAKSEADIYIDQLVVSMVDLEEEKFEKILTKLTDKFGFERSITEVVYPFMEKIGVLWQTGTITPAHEHFISNLIRQKLITSIASLPLPSKKSKKAILFLAEGELHEIGLLFYHYIARKQGFKTFYLGQSVPHEDLKTVYKIHQPDILITSMVSFPSPTLFEKYINTLSQDFAEATILASGMMLRNTAFRIPKNVKPFYKATELPALLATL